MLSRLSRFARSWFDRWHPSLDDRERVIAELSHFYATRDDYHAMTARADKATHPQAVILLSLIKPEYTCVEFGCGGGVILQAAGERAQRIIGLEISTGGLTRARKRCPGAILIQADITKAPVISNSADIVYSFEVVEHVWDPAEAVREMVRVLKPGGTLVLSAPNGYSLDLHLPKHPLARVTDYLGALSAWFANAPSNTVYRNMRPDLTATPAYPDCDMISKLYLPGLVCLLEKQGCVIEMVDAFHFRKENALDAKGHRAFEKLSKNPVLAPFGDHIMIVARKKG